jgi:hypothetical protein
MHSLSALPRFLKMLADTRRVRAQLLPALCVVFPTCGRILLDGRVGRETILAVTIFMAVGGPWFLAQVIHACGQRRMRQLFRLEGGRPAVRMLRHRDRTVDPITKQAWRRCLAGQWGIRLPRRIDERRDPEKADEIYAHAVEYCERCIGDRTTRPGLWEAAVERDLLINGLALRWPGLIAAISAAVNRCVDGGSITIGLRPQLEVAASMSLHPVSNGIVMILAALMALVWLFFFTPDRARVAARSFDLHLLQFGARDVTCVRADAAFLP